jgi:hypothetical protein
MIVTAGPQELVPTEAFGFLDCVSRVGYGLNNTLPRRNFISGEVGGVGYQWLGRKVSSIAFIVTGFLVPFACRAGLWEVEYFPPAI